MDLALFFGRFHPLVVHLPITLVLLGGAFHFLSKRLQYERLGSVVNIIWMLAAVSAIASVIFGWLIAGDKGYEPQTLFLHRWLGVMVAVGSLALWLSHTASWKLDPRHYRILVIFTVLAVGMTGHLGGTLTHGEGYLLQYGPDFLKSMLGDQRQDAYAQLPDHPDSIRVYSDLIAPVMVDKCGSCHNPSQMKGGLDLMTAEGFMAGGDDGPIVVASHSAESELMTRITLPSEHKKFMPPRGPALSYAELALVEWWIDAGASLETRLSDLEDGTRLAELLLRDYAIDTQVKPVYELMDAPPLAEGVIEELRSIGLEASPLGQDINFIEVKVSADGLDPSAANLSPLLAARDQVTWLDLGDAGIDEEGMAVIGQLEFLTRLRLNANPITDASLANLEELTYLESLNLYNTPISDGGIAALAKIKSLKRLYLWQSKISAEGASRLQAEMPDLEIELGLTN